MKGALSNDCARIITDPVPDYSEMNIYMILFLDYFRWIHITFSVNRRQRVITLTSVFHFIPMYVSMIKRIPNRIIKVILRQSEVIICEYNSSIFFKTMAQTFWRSVCLDVYLIQIILVCQSMKLEYLSTNYPIWHKSISPFEAATSLNARIILFKWKTSDTVICDPPWSKLNEVMLFNQSQLYSRKCACWCVIQAQH